MKTLFSSAAAIVGLAVAAQAQGAAISLHYSDINQGTRSGFGFSVLHHPTNSSGSGNILFRLKTTSLDVQWDNVAQTLKFTGMHGQLFQENNLNPGTLGPLMGKIDLAAVSTLAISTTPLIGSDPLAGAGGDFLNGTVDFAMTLFGADGALGGGDDTTRNFTIQYMAKHYNNLANRFNPGSGFSIGLWGATPETFTSGSTSTSLAMDIFASNPVIPLPSAAGLAAFGFCCMGLRRRR